MGIVYYTRGVDDDLEMAEQRLASAWAIRYHAGDRVGQLFTALNLAILCQNLAQSRADWKAAGDVDRRVQLIARQVDVAKAWMLAANHMELLIHRGDVAQAWLQFEEALAAAHRDEPTWIVLLLNRARRALWESDLAQCQLSLARAADEADLAASPPIRWSGFN